MSFADVPHWVILTAVGLLFGGTGMLVFKQRFAPVALVVVSIPISVVVIIPIIEQVVFRRETLVSNQELPMMVDEITRMDEMSFDGGILFGSKSIIYDYSFVGIDDLPLAKDAIRKSQDETAICNHFKEAFRDGLIDQVVHRYAYKGELFHASYSKEECSELEATVSRDLN